MTPDYVLDNMVNDCRILSEDFENLSDHYALCVFLDVPLPVSGISGSCDSKVRGDLSKPCWSDPRFSKLYTEQLDNMLSQIS